jgi:dGTPase
MAKALLIRLQTENREEKTLSPRACLASRTKGRLKAEKECDIRTCFQRDRDRIVHTKSFRRLIHKTQVFLSPEGDHYRTRLTHTLEVSQISRTIARALSLNEDLTEAIALGHDLGHTPFGHIGEEALTECNLLSQPFRHNQQSLRVVDCLERGGLGLNLTLEVRDGILNHTGENLPFTLEGQIVRIADRIAYINHDIDDAIRGQIISLDNIPKEPLAYFGGSHSQRINKMVTDLILASKNQGKILMSPKAWKLMNQLREFLFQKVYLHSSAKSEDDKAKAILKSLVSYYFHHPEKLPAEYHPQDQSDLSIKVCDYISGMTDRYAVYTYENLFIPKSWIG